MKTKEQIYLNKETRLLRGSLLKWNDTIKPKDLSEIIFLMFNRFSHIDRPTTFSVTTRNKSGNYDSRSCEDAFRISRYYIPTITYKQVAEVFVLLKKNSILNHHYCCTCGKTVHSFYRQGTTIEQIQSLLKELNIKIK